MVRGVGAAAALASLVAAGWCTSGVAAQWAAGEVRLADGAGGALPVNASESSSKVFADAGGNLWLLASQFATSKVVAANSSAYWCGVWSGNAVRLYSIAVTPAGGWLLTETATSGPAPDVALRAPATTYVPAANRLVVYSGVRVTDGPPDPSRGCMNTTWWQVVEPTGVFQPPAADPSHCVTIATETWVLDMGSLRWSRVAAPDAGQPPLQYASQVLQLPGGDSAVYALGLQLVAVEGPPWLVAVLGMSFYTGTGTNLLAYTFDPWAATWSLAPVAGVQPCFNGSGPCDRVSTVLGLAFYNPQRRSVITYGGAPWSVSGRGPVRECP